MKRVDINSTVQDTGERIYDNMFQFTVHCDKFPSAPLRIWKSNGIASGGPSTLKEFTKGGTDPLPWPKLIFH